MFRRVTAYLFLFILLFALFPATMAEEAAEGYAYPAMTPEEEHKLDMYIRFGEDAVVETDQNGRIVSVNGYPYRRVRASFRVRSVAEKYTTDTDFVEYPFWQPATTYNGSLANMSLLMAMCAARDIRQDENPDTFDPAQNVEAYLLDAGFTDIRKDDYSKETSIWTISTAIGSRRMEHEGEEPFTLIAVGICGGGYKNEWQSNITVGSGEIHQGFSSAAGEVIDRLAGYIATRGIKGRIKIWISGFSRAAAVANLTAGVLRRAGVFPKEDLYTYTFATPAAVLNPPKTGDENIFNILCPTDIVPQTLPADWGYGRYGTDLYLPVTEFSSIGKYYTRVREEQVRDNFGIEINYSPALNLRMRLLVSLVLDVVRNRDHYVDNVQDTALKLMQNRQASNLLNTMRGLLRGAKDSDSETRGELDDLLNYIFRVFGNAITRTELAAANRNNSSALFLLATEHREDSYLASMFIIQHGIFEEDSEFTYIMVRGPVDLELTAETGAGCQMTLKKDGSVLVLGSDGEIEKNPQHQEYYMERIGNTSVAAIPHDEKIRVSWKAVSDGTVEVRQVNCGFHVSANYPGTTSGKIRARAGDTGAAWLPEGKDGQVPEGFRQETWNADDLVSFLGISRPIVSWRILASLLFLLLGLLLFLILRCVYIFNPQKEEKGSLLWALTALFIVAVTEAEGAYWLLADQPWVRLFWKAVIGISVLAVFFLRYDTEEKLTDGLFPSLAAAIAADLVKTFAFFPGTAFLLLSHILMIVNFLRKHPMNRVQWIQWACLSVIAVGIILFAIGVQAWIAAAFTPVLLLIVYSIGKEKTRIRNAGASLIASDILLCAYATIWPEPLAHILYVFLFNIALILMALNEKQD